MTIICDRIEVLGADEVLGSVKIQTHVQPKSESKDWATL